MTQPKLAEPGSLGMPSIQKEPCVRAMGTDDALVAVSADKFAEYRPAYGFASTGAPVKAPSPLLGAWWWRHYPGKYVGGELKTDAARLRKSRPDPAVTFPGPARVRRAGGR
jgi:hypothetical protein